MKNKLQRFAEIKNFSNVLQPTEPKFIDWQNHFGNNNPIILELACGHGAYTLGLAKMFPNKNFIGIDVKGARIWKGAKIALDEKLTNVAFLRAQIQFLDKYFQKNSVTEIWITFPDPYPKKRHAKNRLTSPRFLQIYEKTLNSDSTLHLKTDDFDLFNYSVETAISENWQIKQIINNIYNIPAFYLPCRSFSEGRSFRAGSNGDPEPNPLYGIKTFYEQQHLKNDKQIHYLQVTK